MRKDLLLGLSLVLAVLALFGRATRFDFVEYDDPPYVTRNPAILQGLTPEGVRWVFTQEHGGNWHPLTGLSHMLDVELFGLNPAGHHLGNVLLHALNALLVFLLLRAGTGSSWRSALVAALFALHPQHVESVAWVSERKDVLSTCLGLLAIGAYGAWTRRGGAGRYLGALALFALSLMAKPMLVTLPFALLLLDAWPLRRLGPVPLKRLLLEKLPFLALTVVLSLVTLSFQSKAMTVDFVPFWLRAVNALVSYVRYLGHTVWPLELACFYTHPNFLGGEPWSVWQLGGALLFLGAVSAWALGPARRTGWAPVGWLWYLGTLVPVIGLVQVGEQALADRYSYVPLLGPFVIAAWGLGALVARGRLPRSVAVTASLLVLAACVPLTWRQLGYWKDSRALFERAGEISPHSPMVLTNLGSQAQERYEVERAVALYREALEYAPEYPPALYNLGVIAEREGRAEEAIDLFERATRADPTHPHYWNALGRALVFGERAAEALPHFAHALELAPDLADAELNRANALARLGRREEARAGYERTLQLEPRNPGAHFNLGLLLRELGEEAPGIAHLAEAVRIDPQQPAFAHTLGWIRATHPDPAQRDPDEAVLLCERANAAAGGQDPVLLDALAAAYASRGDFEQARKLAGRALSLAEALPERPEMAALAESVRAHLASYAQDRAWIER